MVSFIVGKRTYFVVLLMIVYAVIGGYLGKLPQTDAIQLFLQALGLAGLRAGIAKNDL